MPTVIFDPADVRPHDLVVLHGEETLCDWVHTGPRPTSAIAEVIDIQGPWLSVAPLGEGNHRSLIVNFDDTSWRPLTLQEAEALLQ